jgi:predicted dehydrogenase
VLVEKPLDITTASIDAVISDCERAGVKLGVFFQDRAAPDIQWLHSMISSGGLGRIILASARVRWFRPPDYYARSRWRGTWALDGGGALMNQGIHTIDLLLWLLGEPTHVYARSRTALHAIEVEDTVVACIEFASGALATVEVTTAAYPGFPRRLELTGSEGTVILESDRIVSCELRAPPPEPPPTSVGNSSGASPAEQATSPTVSDIRGHRAVLEDFLRAIETGTRPLCDGPEARRSVALVQAIYRSARSGEPVRFEQGGPG